MSNEQVWRNINCDVQALQQNKIEKSPSRHSCVERILAAWESLPSDIIKKSFEVCAISLPIDGSEDEKIHCFQKEAH